MFGKLIVKILNLMVFLLLHGNKILESTIYAIYLNYEFYKEL